MLVSPSRYISRCAGVCGAYIMRLQHTTFRQLRTTHFIIVFLSLPRHPDTGFFSHHHRSHYRTYTAVSRTVKKMASARGPVYRYIACTRVNVEHGTVQLIASYYIPSTPKRIMQAVDSVSACECHYLKNKHNEKSAQTVANTARWL